MDDPLRDRSTDWSTDRPSWDDVPRLVQHLVEVDVRAGDEPRPRVVGADGGDVLGAVEVDAAALGSPGRLVLRFGLALMACGADRLAAALPARAWSPDDPIAPVADGVDLRQRVVAVTTSVPGGAAGARVRTSLLPFALDHHEVVWAPSQDMDGPGDGAVPAVLAALLDERALLDGASAAERSEAVLACLTTGARIVAPAGSPLAELGG